MGNIPERLVNFRAYNGADELLGMTDAELPKFEVMTETISGPGIAGEYASPVLGHFGSQMVKLKWRSTTPQALALIAPVRQTVFLRGSMQVTDSTFGTLKTIPIVIECGGQTKDTNLGKFEPGKAMGAETDIELSKIVITVDGVERVHLDKFNSIFKVNGFDYLRQARIDQGGV